ncbi:hypothetical protein DRE_05966 [Drechslerella stenobrocha 248]|uniref:Uncharacterized protein n=1 Tax=Drechslerella stenobrocha 248 TaxID=1043628 RepID=W7HQ13_9PEZI|nr:hypothetical protein DRE_05966 [Drechslerella stenobrocha 248]
MEPEQFAGPWTDEQTAEASEKVLRRAKVSRMARQLQSRLALASYKTQRGWENLDLDTIEPRVDQDLMKRRMQAIHEGRTISPHHAYSDNDLVRGARRRPSNGSSSHSSIDRRKKRARTAGPGLSLPDNRAFDDDDDDDDRDVDMYDSTHHSFRSYKSRSWKESHRLPQSSPGYHHHRIPEYSGETIDMRHMPRLSFMRSPTQEGSPPLLPRLGRFERDPRPMFHSSPPRTPPHRTIPPRFPPDDDDDRSLGGTVRHHGNGTDGRKRSDGEGADLLLYLASSPSPNTLTKARVSMPPSTPPSKSSTALPSSMMNTPGGGGSGGGGSFNFHDFVHITPSPAQGMWGGGSGRMRTPLTMNARRRLNFDGLAPPSPVGGLQEPSASSQSKAGPGLAVGLGMELGGELVSPTSGS